MNHSETVFLWNPRYEPFVKSGDRTELPPASKAMFGCMAPFILILVISGLVMIGLAISHWQNYDVLNKRGVVTQGEYVNYHMSSTTQGQNSGYTLYYAYTVDGMEYQGSVGTTDLQYTQDAVGQMITVTYDPENPGLSRVGTEGSTLGPAAMTVIAVIWNVVALGFSFALWRVANAPSRLQKTGQLIFGEILEFETSEIPSNERLVQINMRYAFQSPQSQAMIERLTRRPRLREGFDPDNPPQKGDCVAILYGSDKQFEIL